jgi:hypothetical protein
VGLWALALNQSINDKYVIVSADKAPSNIVFVCKSQYKDCLIKELGIDILVGNPTYTPTTLTKEEILDNHRSFLYYIGISTVDEKLDLPALYWIHKLHKCPFKQRYITGSAKCSMKYLSKLLICILSAVKTGLHSYCDTTLKICYSTYNLGCSPPVISIKHLTSLPSTQLLLYLIWRTN